MKMLVETNYGEVMINSRDIEFIEKGLIFGKPIVRVGLKSRKEFECPVENYEALCVLWESLED